MAKLTLSNPMIPLGSTILVTGVNGLIASHVADQLLFAGYRVRGTVRTPSKCTWMESLYSHRHGPGKFELIKVSDFSLPGAWDSAIKGVSGIAHVAGGIDLSVQDVNMALKEELPLHISLLEAAKKEKGVKAFAFTSSAWAAWTPDAKKKVKLSEWTWNEEAITLAASDASPQDKGLANFMALKTKLEQECWEWVKRENPAFTFNAILLDTVLGECLSPENQGIPSTAGMVRWVWKGSNRYVLNMMQPQWYIDTRDTGMLYVAALTASGVDRKRIFGFGERYSWNQVAEILRKLYPENEIAPVENYGCDQTEVPTYALELLQGLGQEGFVNLEESVKANVESFLKLEH
jgi:nucleoside-diphosphate-sugar epimerase